MKDMDKRVNNGFETAIKVENANVRFDKIHVSNIPTGLQLVNSKVSIPDYEFNDVERAVWLQGGSSIELGEENVHRSKPRGKLFPGKRFD